MSRSENIYYLLPKAHEIIADYNVQYRMLGGTALKAMTSMQSVDANTKEIVVDNNLALSTVRENRTLRDVDYLVLTTNESKISSIKYSLEKELGDKVVTSVFGLNRYEQQVNRSYPIKMIDFTSDRLIDNNGKLYYYCHPAIAAVNAESYEEWRINMGNQKVSIPTLSPEAIRAAYLIRSVGGLRPRDASKINELDKSLEKYWPEHLDYRSSKLSEWYDFKKLMEGSITEVGISFVARRSLLHFLDSKKWAIDIAQGGGLLGKSMQPILAKIIHEAALDDEPDNYGLKSYLGGTNHDEDIAEKTFPASKSNCY